MLPIVAFCAISVSLLASRISGNVVSIVEDTEAEGLWNVEFFGALLVAERYNIPTTMVSVAVRISLSVSSALAWRCKIFFVVSSVSWNFLLIVTEFQAVSDKIVR